MSVFANWQQGYFDASTAICDWLRTSEEAVHIRDTAIRNGIPPEDALAHRIEQLYVPAHRMAASPASTTPEAPDAR